MKGILIILAILGPLIFSNGLKSNENNIHDVLYRNRIIGSWAEGESPYTITNFKIYGIYSDKMWKTPHKVGQILAFEGK